MNDCCESKGKSFLSGLIIGGLLGAGLYYLFGTENGKKMQKELKKKGKETAEQLDDLLFDLEEKGKVFKEKAEEVAKEVKGQVTEKIGEVSDVAKVQLGEKLDNTLDKIEKLQEHGREVTESLHSDIKHRFFKNLPKKA